MSPLDPRLALAEHAIALSNDLLVFAAELIADIRGGDL